MLSKTKLFGSLAGLGLLFIVAINVAFAQMPVEMPLSEPSEYTSQFRSIEQPLGLKVGVTLGGIALIGLELWWFLFKAKSRDSN